MKRWRPIGLGITVCALAGCTVVHIQDAHSGDIQVKQHFGFTSIEIDPSKGTTIVEATGFGLLNGFQGFTLGYHDAAFAAVAGGDCRLVVWFKSAEQLDEIKRLLGERSAICAAGPSQVRQRRMP